jgi:hypothetical protein
MDKTLRNVIIFAAVLLVIAIGFTVFMLSKNASSNASSTTRTNANNLGGNSGSNDVNNIPTGEVQNVKLSVSGGTYILTPSVLKKGIPVRMEVDLSSTVGCSRDIVISAFGVRKYVKSGDNIITFTPTQTGTINIACSMNMYRGSFTVV